jgi:hypothetical protein
METLCSSAASDVLTDSKSNDFTRPLSVKGAEEFLRFFSIENKLNKLRGL